ncbi:hypothetical protein [Limosilactobacillus vaginalis]|uniref:DnaD domain-containing protein n=1 Tax=Limosilactobacillus vaginalis TaxID=1633 RepID=A0AAW5WTG6_9LACO|nr:hypothetical protein [Limosilactobacillus vaginalis]MCZ3667743.1 hypothetical protein [Limosilactobacillus vaginalis]MDM8259568.1 hypothetical protein [Limosilactobacillus vaginalis]
MAERRMISKSLLMDNKFLSLSNDTKALYIYLLSFADDDGIVKRSMMIDSVLRVDDENYSALEKNGLIIPDHNDQIKVITDWNSLQSIRKDIYRQTTYLEVRSQLFMRTDYSYTKDPNDKNVFSSADDWIKNGRPKDITDFKPLIQQHLNDRNGIRNDDRNGVRNLSIDQYSLDQRSIDQDSTAQQRAEKGNKDQHRATTTQQRSSNGGMGEILLSDHRSTSTKYNNATTENGVNSGEDNGVNQDAENNFKLDPERTQEIASLFDSLNQSFDVNLSVDDERLRMLFDNLLNQYKIGYIENGLIELSESAGSQNKGNVKSLVVNHLSETVKSLLTN